MESAEFGARRTGALLAEARVAAGLELTDVARTTRVPIRHLRAIEADSHEELPALPYAIGFVKAYARAVGLDGETLASHFRSETTKAAHVPTPISLEPLDERRLPSQGLVFGSLAVVVAIVAGLSAWGAGVFDPAPPAAPPTAVATETPTAPTGDIGMPAAAPDTAPTPTVATSGPVVLTAARDVWVKIYDRTSGKAAKIGVMTAGETYTVPADQPGLLLWTGMAGAVSVSVGGKVLPPLGGPVETVRNVSLLPADLIARTAPAPAAAPSGAPPAAPATAPAANPDLPAPIATPPAPRPIATTPGN